MIFLINLSTFLFKYGTIKISIKERMICLHQKIKLFLVMAVLALLLVACGESGSGGGGDEPEPTELGDRDNTPIVLVANTADTEITEGKVSSIDTTKTSLGLINIRYNGTNAKPKLQIIKDGNTAEAYTYDLPVGEGFITIPFAEDSGSYTITVNENVEGTKYFVIDTYSVTVEIADEFTPFLYSNYYVDFNENSATVEKAKELAYGAFDDIDVVEKVYEFVIGEVVYDYDRAEQVMATNSFYIPVVDETLSTKKGLCFDYAALMSAMLRSQGIPTQLVVGWAGSAYHAWISVYTEETGWVQDIISFNGSEWVRMDPTFASSNGSRGGILEYIGDGENYNALYFY